MINYKVDRNKWFDNPSFAAEARNSRSHRREIDEKWNARKILQQHSSDNERNFLCPIVVRSPSSQIPNILFPNLFTVKVSKYRFQNDSYAYG